MKVVIAPDSFKGSLSAKDVADAIEKGFKKVDSSIEVVKVPMADGGEGTVESLVDATNGNLVYATVRNPLFREIEAFYGILGDGETAIIEMASASGLPLIAAEERNPLVTSTYGTGQLIMDAVEKGCKKIIMGLGGSATNDGGMGMANALGIKFLDSKGCELPLGGGSLDKLKTIEMSGLNPKLRDIEFVAACDVSNPLCGQEGATRVFGPQKGATPEQVESLERNLLIYGKVLETTTGKAVIDCPGAGAAGGLGAAILAFLNANLKSGIDIVVETTELEKKMHDADLVVTGEGTIDYQTAFGKTPCGVAELAKKYEIPVIVIAGGIGKDAHTLYDKGIDCIHTIVNKPMSLDDAIQNAPSLIEDVSERIIRTIKITV